jgi:hypothetical protein
MIDPAQFDNFEQPVLQRVQRTADSYAVTEQYVTDNLERLTAQYQTAEHPQTARLIRDDIDRSLRRYHQYCVQQRWGAHYRETEPAENTVFEHVIPNCVTRALLLAGRITAEQACRMPTCVLSSWRDRELRAQGWTSRTPDCWQFWQRYELCFATAGVFETCTAEPVDTATWTLQEHFEFVRTLS